MKKPSTLLAFGLLVSLFCSKITAQQLPLFTQYRENQALINPGSVNTNFINFERPWSVGLSVRSQWVGVDGAPKTQNVQFEHISARDGVSLIKGGYIINDQAGRVGFTGAYSRIGAILSEDPRDYGIAVGITTGIVQYRVEAVGVNATHQNDPFLMSDRRKIHPDVGLGGMFYKKRSRGRGASDMFYTGISIPQVLGLDTKFKGETGTEYGIKRVQHIYGEVGYYRALRDDYSFIEPSIWVKYVPNGPLHFDAMLRYQFSNFLWLGAGISTAGTFHSEVGFYLGQNLDFGNDLKIGFGYDAAYTRYGPTFGRSLEVNMSYAFGTIR